MNDAFIAFLFLFETPPPSVVIVFFNHKQDFLYFQEHKSNNCQLRLREFVLLWYLHSTSNDLNYIRKV